MNTIWIWFILFVISLSLNIFWYYTEEKAKAYKWLKTSLVYMYLSLGILCALDIEKTIQIEWIIESVDIWWGWDITAGKLVFISLLFALNTFSDRKLSTIVLAMLSSLVILSSFNYQMVGLYALFSFVAVGNKSIQYKGLIFPAALMTFMSYEEVWHRKEVLSLSETLAGSFSQLYMLILVCMFIYHLAILLAAHHSLRPYTLIAVAVTQFVVSKSLSSYLDATFIHILVGALCAVWLTVSAVSVSTKFNNRFPDLSFRLFIVQISLFSLLPLKEDLAHYVILALGLTLLLSQSLEKRRQESIGDKLTFIYSRLIIILAPISWVGLWTYYELSRSMGSIVFPSVILCLSALKYSCLSMIKLKLDFQMKDIKKYQHLHIPQLIKLIVLTAFMTCTAEAVVGTNTLEIVLIILSVPSNWPFLVLWLLIFVGVLYVKHTEALGQNYLKLGTSFFIPPFKYTQRFFDSTTSAVYSALVKTFIILWEMILITVKSFHYLLGMFLLGCSGIAKPFHRRYEYYCLLMLCTFFMFHIWRQSA